MNKHLLTIGAVLALAGCGPESGNPEGWAGRWTGVEGTYLDLTPAGEDAMTITIRTLDGVNTYEGKIDAGNILFMQDEQQQTIKHASGAETGMKWLQEKDLCLIVEPDGEGYCRD